MLHLVKAAWKEIVDAGKMVWSCKQQEGGLQRKSAVRLSVLFPGLGTFLHPMVELIRQADDEPKLSFLLAKGGKKHPCLEIETGCSCPVCSNVFKTELEPSISVLPSGMGEVSTGHSPGHPGLSLLFESV